MPSKVEAEPQPVVEAEVVSRSQAIQPYRQYLAAEDVALSPVMDIALAKQRLSEFQAFVGEYLIEGEDFGTIPGTPKPTLYKAGADKLCELYGLADDYIILDQIEDYGCKPGPLFDYNIKCVLTSKRFGFLVATGLGSGTSHESRYLYRDSQRKCPKCEGSFIIKGKEEYGGGWLCFAKKGGCGAKFNDDDPAISSQAVGKVINDDIPTLKNTILKMAKKRAKVDAALAATRSSGIFTQDVEDFPSSSENGKRPAPEMPKRKSEKVEKVISEGQVKRFWAIARKEKWADGEVKAILSGFGYEHTDEIKMADYDEIIAKLQEAGPKEQVTHLEPPAPAGFTLRCAWNKDGKSALITGHTDFAKARMEKKYAAHFDKELGGYVLASLCVPDFKAWCDGKGIQFVEEA